MIGAEGARGTTDAAASRDVVSRGLDERAAFAWILALAALTFAAGLGLRDPWPADEPRFAQVAREMVESGRWLFPTRGGELYSDKPPVFMWAVAGLYRLTGEMRVAFLLPSMLAALGTLALTHDIARRLWNRRTANVAALLLVATLQFGLQARTAQIDMLACSWIALGAYGLLRHLVAGPAIGWYLGAWFAMGLGVITKGVGFLPVLMLVPWAALLLATRGTSPARGAAPPVTRPSLAMLAGPLFLLAAVATWLVPMWLAVESSGDPALAAYRDDILFRQTGERYTDSWAHVSPWWYFPVEVIPAFWLPLSVLLAWLVRPWAAAFRARDPRIVLPVVWVVLVVAFFSASPGKRGVYVLPALPMLALAAAPHVETLLARVGVRRAAAVLLGGLGALLTIVGIAGLIGMDALAAAELEEGIRPWSLLVALGIVALGGAALAHRSRPALGWFAFVVPLWVLYGTWGYAAANPGRTPIPVYRTLLDAVGDDVRVALPDFREQWLLFAPVPVVHFGYRTPDEDQQREVWRWLDEPDDDGRTRYALVSDRMPAGCFDVDAGLSLGRGMGRTWTLLSTAERRTTCPVPDAPVPRFDYAQGGALPLRR